MMDAGLSTTPAEEVPLGGFDDRDDAPHVQNPERPPQTAQNGIKRLTSKHALERGLDKEIKDAIERRERKEAMGALADRWRARAVFLAALEGPRCLKSGMPWRATSPTWSRMIAGLPSGLGRRERPTRCR